MILIADSGSTKTTWSLVSHQKEISRFQTEGYNPYFVTENYIVTSILKSLDATLSTSSIEAVHFYGAGCESGKASVVVKALQYVFWRAEVFVFSDLLAAARGLLGDSEGFAAILGTGCNTCIYDGEKIVQHIDSLGYVLGDEGSASYLGKKILQDYLRGKLPEMVKMRFVETYNLKHEDIIAAVYSKPMANRYCAGFSQFLRPDCSYSTTLVRKSFTDFFQNLVSLYPNYSKYSFNCSGSVGEAFKHLLEETALSFGMRTNRIEKYPIEGLIDYHLKMRVA